MDKLIENQQLILYFLEGKLDVVNYIRQGWEKETSKVLMYSQFLHRTAHIYYRSLYIDYCALYGVANPNNKNSFRHLIKRHRADIDPQNIMVLEWLLNNYHQDVLPIKTLIEKRNSYIAHYDMSEETKISFRMENLQTFNELLPVSKRIIALAGPRISLPPDGNLELLLLKDLLEKVKDEYE